MLHRVFFLLMYDVMWIDFLYNEYQLFFSINLHIFILILFLDLDILNISYPLSGLEIILNFIY